MNSSTTNTEKYLFYVLLVAICFAGYPIIRYYYFVFFEPNTRELKFFVAVRTYFSAPLFLLSGIILIVYYKRWVIGLFNILAGLLVIGNIIHALASY